MMWWLLHHENSSSVALKADTSLVLPVLGRSTTTGSGAAIKASTVLVFRKHVPDRESRARHPVEA
jgi:hypothetical protein